MASVENLNFWCSLLILPLLSYIAYHRRYYRTQASYWNYGYYPIFKPFHRLRNLIYFTYYGKHSCFIHAKTESTIVQQNDVLNKQYASTKKDYVRIVCISDTHELHKQLNIPNGDILIHCGDILFANSHKYSQQDSIKKIYQFNEWLGSLPHQNKLIIAGNHDYCFEKIGKQKCQQILTNATYLINDTLTLKFNHHNHDKHEIKLFCSPFSIPNSKFSPNRAFQCERDEIGDKIWSQIPEDVDILVTHHMPHQYMGNGKGCIDLLKIIKNKCVKCKYHIFGHWHGTYGVKFGVDHGKEFKNKYRKNVCFMNASSVDSFVCVLNPPLVFDYHCD